VTAYRQTAAGSLTQIQGADGRGTGLPGLAAN
jgi:hypothetical protein